jgi:hypothetical protein
MLLHFAPGRFLMPAPSSDYARRGLGYLLYSVMKLDAGEPYYTGWACTPGERAASFRIECSDRRAEQPRCSSIEERKREMAGSSSSSA